jgi:hypothetical protein
MSSYETERRGIKYIVYRDTVTFDFAGCKRDNSDFTEQEVDDLNDSFLEWVEKHDLWVGGGFGLYEEEVEDGV